MEKPLLKISNISKKYLFNEVLKSININLHPGKFYTLVGENGAGKSTIFKIIVGLEYPNTGTACYWEKNSPPFPPKINIELA